MDVVEKLLKLIDFKQEYSPGVFAEEAEQLKRFSLKAEASAESDSHTEIKKIAQAEDLKVEKDLSMPLINESWNQCRSLHEFAAAIGNCDKCSHLAAKRKNLVFGSGNPDADIAVVGEAPGADEDEQGFPFVGRAGKLLTDILAAIKLSREEVYICNILKCRPPENRNPMPDEILNCEPYLAKQLELIKPKLILALGTFAAQTLLKTKEPLGKLRGRFHLYKDIKTMVTYHPAALLRNPNWKRPAWEDVKMLRKEYDNLKEAS